MTVVALTAAWRRFAPATRPLRQGPGWIAVASIFVLGISIFYRGFYLPLGPIVTLWAYRPSEVEKALREDARQSPSP